MKLCYNTNGFAHHRLGDALSVIAGIGYQGVGLTLDHGALDPYSPSLAREVDEVSGWLRDLGLSVVVETGGRFLLNPWTKHEPSLVSASAADRARRVDFYRRAFDIAAGLGADRVSIWSGVVRDGATPEGSLERLARELSTVLRHAADVGVWVCFEPEPGMRIATLDDYAELRGSLERGGARLDALRLTADVGHLHCQGEDPVTDRLVACGAELANVHIEDARRGVHEHLAFGEGSLDYPRVVRALRAMDYDGPLTVELSRHSHDAPAQAKRAFEALAPLLLSETEPGGSRGG